MKTKTNEFEALLLNSSISNTAIEQFVISKSNLPSPRANLSFAAEFANYFQRKDVPNHLWQMVMQWAHIAANEAPNNTPREFLPFCAIQAIGAHFQFSDQREQLIEILKAAMSDSRWRMKESTAIALQIIGEQDFSVLEQYFNVWLAEKANLLEQRAMLATLAHPPILKDSDNAKFALKIADNIMLNTIVISFQNRKSEEFRVLKKGLAYCLSVFVCALPEQGFQFLDKYSRINDKDIKSIIKSNLSKGRLKNKYPLDVLKISENITHIRYS